MNTSREDIIRLWEKLIDNKATFEEIEKLVNWLKLHPDDEFSRNYLAEQVAAHQATDTGDQEYWTEKLKTILQKEDDSEKPTPVRPIKTLNLAWLKYAVAVIAIVGIAVYLLYKNESKTREAVQTAGNVVKNDIPAGSEKATLTLSNGKNMELTKQAGVIEEAGTTISIGNGELKYGNNGEMVFNTVTTPRGGQYKLILPDGSGVWLNAASGITFPTAFKGKFREVSVTGEAYFEITKNREQPFKVNTGNSDILVFGTSFNVNNYQDGDGEAAHTTLVEGSLKISTGAMDRQLIPGQQAVISGKQIKLNDNVDLEKVLAWKNGEMVLSESTTKKLMQEISRWYDVDIEYRGNVPDRKFYGSVSRNVPLSSILTVLKAYGINSTLEGKKLIVSENEEPN